MQSTTPSALVQSDIANKMQPQSTPNMIMTSNKKKKYVQQACSSSSPHKHQTHSQQQSNQQLHVNKSFNIVPILKTSAVNSQQQQQQQHQQQQQQQQSNQKSITPSYANVVNRSLVPQSQSVLCSGGGGVVTVNNCQLSSDGGGGVNATAAAMYSNVQRTLGGNNNSMDGNPPPPTHHIGYISAADAVAAGAVHCGGGNGGGGVVQPSMPGNGGGGVIGLQSNSSTICNNAAIGVPLGSANGIYTHDKGVAGVNVGCIDSRKYEFKTNKLMTNNNFQSTQEYIPSNNANNATVNVRGTPQPGNMYRTPPNNGPRAVRHMPMQTMYPQAMHQGVVMPLTQYAPRQTFPAQFQYTQPVQHNPYYSFQFYPAVPQTHRNGVGVGASAGVNVGNPMSVQTGPNGPLSVPPGAGQGQIPLATGAVLAGGVPPGTSAVLGVPTPAGGQVGVPSMVGVLPTVPPPQKQQAQPPKLRRYALEIRDPITNKNILEDLNLTKNTSNSESDHNQDQQQTVIAAPMQQDMSIGPPQSDHPPMVHSNIMVMPSDVGNTMPYNLDMHQSQPQPIVGQTPIVSAMTDAPSVEILPTPPKPRTKKIIQIVPPRDQEQDASKNQLKTGVEIKQNQSTKQQQQQQQSQDLIRENIGENSMQTLPSVGSAAAPVHHQNYQFIDTSSAPPPPLPVVDRHQQQQQSSSAATVQLPPQQQQQPPLPDCQLDDNRSADQKESIIITSKDNIAEGGEIVADRTTQQKQQVIKDQQTEETTSSSSTFITGTNAATTDGFAVVTAAAGAPQTTATTTKAMQLNASSVEVTAAAAASVGINGQTSIESARAETLIKTDKSKEVGAALKVPETETKASDTTTTTITTQAEAKDEIDRGIMSQPAIECVTATGLTQKSESRPIEQQQQQEGAKAKPMEDVNKETITAATTVDTDAGTTVATDVNSEQASADGVAGAVADQSAMPSVPADAESLINYNEGQWSPSNPNGKKQYNREQLLQLRDAKASRVQPVVSNTSILPQPNLMPSFMRNNNKRVQSMMGSIGGNRERERDGGSERINAYGGGKQSSMSGVNSRNSMKGMIHVNLSLNQDVKLSETDNAWRPRALVKGGDGEIDPEVKSTREKDELIRRVRGILNKLTPEKFDTLVGEIIKLRIDTQEKMEAVMVLVFEKAIDEPNFSTSYARLCHRLISEVKARDERELESATKTNLAHFRNALLDKTEREFTQNVTQSSAKEQKLQPIINKIKACTDPNEKTELEALLEEEERKIRRRSGGTVRFIGELFKISMLTGKIINSCIEALLNPNSEDMLECLCKLLTTVGAKFEQSPMFPKEQNSRCYSLDKVIARMQAIASKSDKDGSRVSSRVRFMLQDVIDLRKNKWQSTRNEAPKTMEQIEKETKNEQLSSQYLSSQYGGSIGGGGGGGGGGGNSNASNNSMSSGKRDDRGGGRYDSRSSSGYGGSHSQRGGDGGSMRRQGGGGGGGGGGGNNRDSHSSNNNDDNTWQLQTGKGNRSLDTNKLGGILTQNLDTKKMGGLSQFLWNNNAQRHSATPTTTPQNSFAALSSLTDKNSSNSGDRDHRDHRDSSAPRNKGSYNKGSMERDRYGGDRNMHSRSGSTQASRENSSSRGSQGPVGVRGLMNPSSMQKSASHSKYTQQQMSSSSDRSSSSRGGSGKSSAGIQSMPSGGGSASGSNPYSRGGDHKNVSSYNQTDSTSSPSAASAASTPTAPPKAVFDKYNANDLKLIKAVLTEMIEIASISKTINSSIVPCIERIRESQRCGLIYYILEEYLHLRDVGPTCRRSLANIVAYLIRNNFLSVEHFKLSYEQFCELASDLMVDIPDLWWYIFQFTGPLITKKILTLNDLWIDVLKADSCPNLGQKFLKAFLKYCTQEIGPQFTRNMWKELGVKWTDFMAENEVNNFITSNNFGYINNENVQPVIECKDNREKIANRVVEHVDYLLRDGATVDSVIDYISGNIVDVDKYFIRLLTTTLCEFAISYKDGSYKLDTTSCREKSLPVLQRYIDSKEERELECLHAMLVLVNSYEHPRGLLNELFVEFYDADVITAESFIKWRDSKDQSAGKGVAVKALNPFFNHVLSGETSDENN